MPDNLIKQQAEHALVDPQFDFIAKYHAVTDLRRLLRHTPNSLDRKTLAAVEALLQSDQFKTVRQNYFLYREAAKIAKDMIVASSGTDSGIDALETLKGLLLRTNGNAHRGVAEALGSLPLSINGAGLPKENESNPPAIAWEQLIRANGLDLTNTIRYIGRSLVAQTMDADHFLVVKLAKQDDSATGLAREIRWMEALACTNFQNGMRFHIPNPLRVHGQPVFRIEGLPLAPSPGLIRHPRHLAIAFVTHKDYFVYPNEKDVTGEAALEILARSAYLMAGLAARGIVHDAPIPLFHNRTQRLRRDDQGRYQWFRAGRLDRWLDSCAFPNLGLSGLRDFEHFISFSGQSSALYRHMGTHLFSLLLVAGSHFRARDISRRGLDESGRPVDTRDLFDVELLREMIVRIYENYYQGFCGSRPTSGLPFNVDRLVRRMVEEMGVDRHMTELFRRADQQQLPEDQFRSFLAEKGFDEKTVEEMRPGSKDILFHSGPHLGDFNRKISLPEMIDAVAAMSAVCTAGRYLAEEERLKTIG